MQQDVNFMDTEDQALQQEQAAAPQETPAQPEQQARPKTEKEQILDSLIAKRQEILNKLKEKNPLLPEARKKIAAIIPSLRGKGGSRTLDLMQEAERIEFSIATEAYTPKKEKELIKRLREIKTELSKNKELDAARKQIEEARGGLNTLISEIRSLESDLAAVRKECDAAYAEVVAERKSAYEQRQKGREHARAERFENLKRTVRDDKRRRDDAEMQKYMKDYDDTVSMEEIVVFEKKEKKKD